jgi:hypothetical protein
VPPLENPKLELYAQELAKGTPVKEAFIAAGFVYNAGNAYTRKNDERVQKRIAELLSERAHIHNEAVKEAVQTQKVTVEKLIAHADEIRHLAVKGEQFGAATSALKEIGVLTGLRVERGAHLVKASHSLDIESMTDDELEAHLREVQKRLREEQRVRCERQGFDTATITLEEYWALEDFEREQRAALNAHDITPPQRAQVSRRGVKLPKSNGVASSVSNADIDRRQR